MNAITVWLALIAITLAEVALAWVHLGTGLTLTLLLALSAAKAGLIAWYFMHLRDHRPRALTLIIPALFVFIGCLLALIPDGIRAGALR